jgi:hypothetical protein
MIIGFVILLIVLIIPLVIYFKPKYVELELVMSLHDSKFNLNDESNNFNSELHWWFIDSYSSMDLHKLSNIAPNSGGLAHNLNLENLKYWGVDFNTLGIDFNKNNIIISFSRKIEVMKFKRAEWFPYKRLSLVKTIMSKKMEPHAIYIYVIPKYEVGEDVRAYTETTVEK